MKGRDIAAATGAFLVAAACVVTSGCGLIGTHPQGSSGSAVPVAPAPSAPAKTTQPPNASPSQQPSSPPASSPAASQPAAPKSGPASQPAATSGSGAAAFNGARTVNADQYRGRVTPIGFQSPSGNINCGISGNTVVCQIVKYDYTPPAHNCGGAEWGSNFRLSPGKPAEMFCAGDVEGGGPTLAYGDQLVSGHVRCVSRPDGVTCQNTASGYGFKLSRQNYSFFPSGAQGSSGGVPDGFVTTWYAHGMVLKINPDGNGTIDYRTYVDCSKGSARPCDTTKGNTIYPGGHIEFTVHPSTPTKIIGQVTNSNDTKLGAGSEMIATLDGHILRINRYPGVNFCPSASMSDPKCGS